MDLSTELQIAKTIARMAASVCHNIQSELVDPSQKAGREPVTVADYASQAIIGNGLAENFPDDAVLSEERSEDFMLLLNDQQRALVQRFLTDALGGYVFEEQVAAWLDVGKDTQASRTWVVDPIDGTKGFLRHEHYCVAVSLLVDGEPVLGVLASPGFYRDEADAPDDPGALIAAAAGLGATIEPLFGGEPVVIRASANNDPARATFLTSIASGHTDMSLFDRLEKALKRGPDAPVRRLDSQDKHGMVATGLGDVLIRLVPEETYREKVWDHAAGYVIVTEAGGRMTDVFGQNLDWTAGSRLQNNRGILVTNGYLHEKVLAALKDAMA
ncbi:MAG: inositol monophosphatase family protein [Anaerolineae bacterium]|nr:inositol monophosphatase family protein [Anaerolineae bacterium]